MDLELRGINRGAGGDTAIAIGDDEIADSKASSSCVIDINGKGLVGEKQSVCRICHLSDKESGKTPVELSEIGCGCKGELGVAHSRCAEAWLRFGVIECVKYVGRLQRISRALGMLDLWKSGTREMQSLARPMKPEVACVGSLSVIS